MTFWQRRALREQEAKDAVPNYGGGQVCRHCGHLYLEHNAFPGEDQRCTIWHRQADGSRPIECKCPGYQPVEDIPCA